MSFKDKQRKLIATLKDAEAKSSYTVKSKSLRSNSGFGRGISQARKQTHYYRGKESIFKRPEAPIVACLPCRKLPDYVKNPTNWTHYSLENVPDISDRSNAEAVAMCRRDMSLDIQSKFDIDQDDSKVEFKQPVLLVRDTKTKAVEYKNSIVIYPEYVVGQHKKVDKINKEKNRRNHTNPVLKLDHLIEDEEDNSD